VALTRPDHAGLKRFTFFVSRRREEGRERFRLHMGYFPTQEEAEKLLDIVREFYPGAWAGLAPGQRLRAAAAAAAAARVAPPPEPASAPPPTLALVPDAGRPRSADVESDDAAAATLTSVRAAIASLDDAPEIPRAAPQPNVPELKPAPETLLRADVPVIQPARIAVKTEVASVSAQVPTAMPVKLEAKALAKPSAKPMVKPVAKPAVKPEAIALETAVVKDSTAGTKSPVLGDAEVLQVLEKGASTDGKAEPACFAVQLMWSVQPIEMGKVPQLAIFSAYTLYAAEGNRNGRRWYGLRLGFFTDAMSAKQVAQYVRSEFSTVSIVPVTIRERERASSAAPVRPALPTATSAKTGVDEFAFIDDKPASAPSVPPAPRQGGAPGKRAKLRSAAPKPLPLQRKARKELSLEETLEILGADQLQMQIDGADNSPASVSESGVRHLQLQQVKGKGSRLGRLINRLSGLDKN
jgi:hypothetical protein